MDSCFRDHSIMCPPTAIGQAARNAYQRRVSSCSSNSYPEGDDESNDRLRRNRKHRPIGQPLSVPSAIQFISLFGYLQTRCRRRRTTASSGETGSFRRNSQNGAMAADEIGSNNCSVKEFDEMISSCEEEIRKLQPKRHTSVVDRHQLLRSVVFMDIFQNLI